MLPLIFMAACAVQQPASPPAEPVPAQVATEADDMPAPAPVAEQPVDAPSAQKVAALRTWIDQQNRLYTVAAPLLINNTELCKRNARYLLGVTAKTRYSYSNEYVDVARSALGLDDRLRIMSVLPGSGAALRGVRPGDILLAVENKPMPKGRNAERDGAMVVSSAMKGRSSLNLTILRDGRRLAINVPLTRACAFGIELGNADYVNSYADGVRAMITRGMLNFTNSDEELAYAIAKEIAHNVLARTPRPSMGAVIDRLRAFDAEAKSPPKAANLKSYSPVLDATADKLSLYLLARAGYGIDNAPSFWKRLASRYPETVAGSHTALHPSTSYRLSVMSEIVKTIKTKQARQLPLVP